MNSDLIVRDRTPFSWYEETLSLRGLHMSLVDVKELYKELWQINIEFGEKIISDMSRNPDFSDDQWEAFKKDLLDDAFRLTVTIHGMRDQKWIAEDVSIFEKHDASVEIKSIYFSNLTAYRRHAEGGDPRNIVEVHLDFGKPDLFDARLMDSEATPNGSEVRVVAQDTMFFNAVQKAVEKKVAMTKTWYGSIHRNFAYDAGLWFCFLPLSLYLATYYMDQFLPVGSKYEVFRWPSFIYLLGLALIGYRFLISYLKWAFPVNSLKENNDNALKHRIALLGAVSWVFYKVADTLYGLGIG